MSMTATASPSLGRWPLAMCVTVAALRLFASTARNAFPAGAYCLPTDLRGINLHAPAPRFWTDCPDVVRLCRLRIGAGAVAVAGTFSLSGTATPAGGHRGGERDAVDPPHGDHG